MGLKDGLVVPVRGEQVWGTLGTGDTLGSCGLSREEGVGGQPEATVVGLVAPWAGTAKGSLGGRLPVAASFSVTPITTVSGLVLSTCSVSLGPRRHLCTYCVLVLGVIVTVVSRERKGSLGEVGAPRTTQ